MLADVHFSFFFFLLRSRMSEKSIFYMSVGVSVSNKLLPALLPHPPSSAIKVLTTDKMLFSFSLFFVHISHQLTSSQLSLAMEMSCASTRELMRDEIIICQNVSLTERERKPTMAQVERQTFYLFY